MTTDPQSLASLLRQLAAGLCSHPEALETAFQPSGDGLSCFFGLEPHPDDESKLIGRLGANAQALRYIAYKLGQARGQLFTLKVITKHQPGARPPSNGHTALRHDPEPTRLLITRILEELRFDGIQVTVGPANGEHAGLAYVFTIRPPDAAAAFFLNAPESDTPEGAAPLTILSCLGLLIRAAGKQSGVSYQLAIAS